jgi:hypothetical protein
VRRALEALRATRGVRGAERPTVEFDGAKPAGEVDRITRAVRSTFDELSRVELPEGTLAPVVLAPVSVAASTVAPSILKAAGLRPSTATEQLIADYLVNGFTEMCARFDTEHFAAWLRTIEQEISTTE